MTNISNSISDVIAARLTAARKVRYPSARRFAMAYDIPVTTYSQHETGKRILGVAALLEYSDYLKINPAWLLTGKGLPYPNDDGALECQASLYQYLSEADQDLLVNTEQSYLIDGEVAEVEVLLLKDILTKVVAHASAIQLNEAELINFALETYNSVVQTTASTEDKLRMVDLSINSLIRGGAAVGERLGRAIGD